MMMVMMMMMVAVVMMVEMAITRAWRRRPGRHGLDEHRALCRGDGG